MAQHFLLSAKARTLSVVAVARMSDDEARATFRALRWASTNGDPVCPHCGCVAVYEYQSRPIFKCQGCGHQFSVTSGTIFASRKLAFRDILLAIAIFVNAVKGISALQLCRDLNVQYKTAFVMAHKLREAMALEQQGAILSGEVEVDGAYFGGYVRPENRKEDRKDRRLRENQTGKRRVVVVSCANATAGRCRSCSRARISPSRRSASTSPTARSCTPTKRRHGTNCMRATILAGSTTASRSWTKASAPIRLRATSAGCVVPSGASTTTSAGGTCSPTLPRWRGARIIAGFRTASSSRALPLPAWRTR